MERDYIKITCGKFSYQQKNTIPGAGPSNSLCHMHKFIYMIFYQIPFIPKQKERPMCQLVKEVSRFHRERSHWFMNLNMANNMTISSKFITLHYND